MTVGTYGPTISTGGGAQTSTAYLAQNDANSAVMARSADNFAPHPAATPAMSVVVDAGFVASVLPTGQQVITEVAQQTVTIAAAPGAPNNRIDIVVINSATGVASVIAGTAVTSPVPPAIPAGRLKVAQISVPTGTTVIGNSLITDLRTVWQSGVPGVPWAVAGGTGNAITAAYAPANITLTDGLLLAFRSPGANTIVNPTFTPDGLTSHTITKSGGINLAAGDIPAGWAECLVRFHLATATWELLNPYEVAPALTGAAIDAALGFTPVQQGTGVGQLTNTVRIGWSTSGLKVTVDATDLGVFATQAFVLANQGGFASYVVSATSITATANSALMLVGGSNLTATFPTAAAASIITILTSGYGGTLTLSGAVFGGAAAYNAYFGTSYTAPGFVPLTSAGALAYAANATGTSRFVSDGTNWYLI